jgi:methyl-accepting chemotaxis protein
MDAAGRFQKGSVSRSASDSYFSTLPNTISTPSWGSFRGHKRGRFGAQNWNVFQLAYSAYFPVSASPIRKYDRISRIANRHHKVSVLVYPSDLKATVKMARSARQFTSAMAENNRGTQHMHLRSFTIGVRAAAGFSIITLIVLFLGFFCLMQMATLDRATNRTNEIWIAGITSAQKLSVRINAIRLEGQRMRASKDPQVRLKSQALIASTERSLESQMAEFRNRKAGSDEVALLDVLKRSLDIYLPALHDFVALLDNRDPDTREMERLSSVLANVGDDLTHNVDQLVRHNETGASAAAQESHQLYANMQLIISLILASSVVVTITLAIVLTRSIVYPIRQAVLVAQTIAGGVLNAPIDARGSDEPAALLGAMRKMQTNLRSTIEGIGDSAQQLAAAAEEMTAIMGQSTQGLQQQSDQIAQAATAVTEMSSAVDEVASNAVSTSNLSQASDHETQKGHEQVNETIALIQGLAQDVMLASDQANHLSRHASEINTVLSVIHSISDQTNLLALNAAIEAARAGDAGRGFAVVADEVRSLAKRTQASTVEIGNMIESIQTGTGATVAALHSSANKASQTLERARSAGQALEQITLAISRINERNMVIASATEQQAQVAREVDRSLVTIRDLSTQSATGASQTSHASSQLSRLAVDLNGMISRFSI